MWIWLRRWGICLREVAYFILEAKAQRKLLLAIGLNRKTHLSIAPQEMVKKFPQKIKYLNQTFLKN